MNKYFFVVIILSASLFSCEQRPSYNIGEVVAYVNKEPILTSELQESIQLKSRQDPFFKVTKESRQEQLNLIIERKLMIQEAIDDGLIEDPEFVETIKKFWEQTLIKKFFLHKGDEFSKNVTVTEKEMKDYYNLMRWQVTFMVYEGWDEKEVDHLYEQVIANKVTGFGDWDIIGPRKYNELNSAVLTLAFNNKPGEFKKYEQNNKFYLISITNKKEVEVKPFTELKAQIKQRVINKKEKDLFDNWLKSKKKKANIEYINEE